MQKNVRKATRAMTTNSMISIDINGDGHKTRIDLSSLNSDRFTAYHGTTNDGNTVNSIHGLRMGKSTILRSGKRGPAFAATNDELEVFATKFLTDRGFSISSPVSTDKK